MSADDIYITKLLCCDKRGSHKIHITLIRRLEFIHAMPLTELIPPLPPIALWIKRNISKVSVNQHYDQEDLMPD